MFSGREVPEFYCVNKENSVKCFIRFCVLARLRLPAGCLPLFCGHPVLCREPPERVVIPVLVLTCLVSLMGGRLLRHFGGVCHHLQTCFLLLK